MSALSKLKEAAFQIIDAKSLIQRQLNNKGLNINDDMKLRDYQYEINKLPPIINGVEQTVPIENENGYKIIKKGDFIDFQKTKVAKNLINFREVIKNDSSNLAYRPLIQKIDDNNFIIIFAKKENDDFGYVSIWGSSISISSNGIINRHSLNELVSAEEIGNVSEISFLSIAYQPIDENSGFPGGFIVLFSDKNKQVKSVSATLQWDTTTKGYAFFTVNNSIDILSFEPAKSIVFRQPYANKYILFYLNNENILKTVGLTLDLESVKFNIEFDVKAGNIKAEKFANAYIRGSASSTSPVDYLTAYVNYDESTEVKQLKSIVTRVDFGSHSVTTIMTSKNTLVDELSSELSYLSVARLDREILEDDTIDLMDGVIYQFKNSATINAVVFPIQVKSKEINFSNPIETIFPLTYTNNKKFLHRVSYKTINNNLFILNQDISTNTYYIDNYIYNKNPSSNSNYFVFDKTNTSFNNENDNITFSILNPNQEETLLIVYENLEYLYATKPFKDSVAIVANDKAQGIALEDSQDSFVKGIFLK